VERNGRILDASVAAELLLERVTDPADRQRGRVAASLMAHLLRQMGQRPMAAVRLFCRDGQLCEVIALIRPAGENQFALLLLPEDWLAPSDGAFGWADLIAMAASARTR